MIVECIARSVRLLAACGLVLFFLADSSWSQESSLRLASDVREMRASLSATVDDTRRPASGTYDVVTLRVEFQPDTSRFTTGDGTFADALYGELEPSVDPMPHDADYFQAHLDFLRDYVGRVSDGTVNVRTHLLPQVIQVSRPMAFYAPTGPQADSDAELSKLAALVREAWMIANDEIAFDMSSFVPEKTAFAIFHAGVGRDVELIGTTLDKTPEDLPSLFFDSDALDRLEAGSISFNGFLVDHTMILPRTETRPGTDFIADEPFLLELSINGLIAASFFNFLGVPDLFDTQTGESAIGPFGLMDTQGIFAYRGLFPPEPMAWTKYFLGWTEPESLGGGTPETVHLQAASVLGSSESARAFVSDAEYFLVENRFRDPEHDGLVMRVWKDGSIVEQQVDNGATGFNSFNIEDFVGGVVIGVDNYDWALPGGLDENENPLNGGILIWHVDERRLRTGLPRNAVNVGAGARAIDLEEADGAQDVGFPSGAFGPQAELGTPFDFYYEGNPVTVVTVGNREIRLYENRFGPDTFPSSETNGGGPSFVVLEGFSEPASEMSFTHDLVGVHGIEPIVLETAGELEEIIRSGGLTFGSSSSITGSVDAPIAHSEESQSAIALTTAETYGASAVPVTSETHLVTLTSPDDGPAVLRGLPLEAGSGVPEWAVDLPVETAGMEPASPLVRSASGSFYAILQDSTESVLVQASPTGARIESADGFGRLNGIAAAPASEGGGVIITGNEAAGFSGETPRWTYQLPASAAFGRPIFGRDASGYVGAVPVTSSGILMLLLDSGEVLPVDVAAASNFAARQGQAPDGSLSSYPVLADLDDDGHLDVLLAYGSQLFAFTQSGAVVGGFPKLLPADVAAQPLLARFGGEGRWTIFTAARNGYLYAHDSRGLRRGFPLEVGNTADATPLIAGNRLYAVSGMGTLKTWELPMLDEVWWGELHRDGDNSSFVSLSSSPESPDAALIDAAETYNWPNPIENGSTHLRIRTERDARVEITIIDAGGGLVESLDMGLVRGGIPTEIEWGADVESGLYFARFTASSDEGGKETTVVKMAVIR